MTEHEAQPASEREQAPQAAGREQAPQAVERDQAQQAVEREQTRDDGAQVSTGKEKAGAHEAAIPELVIISGMSGAGRSTAAKCLEDLGWFVVDNLPPALIPTMVELGARSQGNVARIAVVVDVRGRRFFDNLRESLADLEARAVTRRIVFLESSDDALVRRFAVGAPPAPPPGRRPHRRHGIAAERELLRELRGDADLVTPRPAVRAAGTRNAPVPAPTLGDRYRRACPAAL
ncbi:RNase adapter protein RapZ [Streptomyces tendae]